MVFKDGVNRATMVDIENRGLYETEATAQCGYEWNKRFRDIFIEAYGVKPENMLSKKDCKKVERKYKRITKKLEEELGL